MEELGKKAREEGGGERVGAPFNVLPPGATDLVAPLTSRFIKSASAFSSRFTSSSTSQLISDIIHTLVIHHSFTLSLQAQNLSFNKSFPPDFNYLYWTASRQRDWTAPITLIILFLVLHFNFLFVPCGR